MDIRFKYKKIFQDLLANKKGLQLYTLHRRYNLPASKVIDFINEYSPRGIIMIEDDTTVTLTHKGRDNFRQIIKDLFRASDFSELTYLAKRCYSPMAKYTPYIPSDIVRFEMARRDIDEEIDEFELPFQ